MYTERSLSGIDLSTFWDYWNSIKNEIGRILGLGSYLYEMESNYQKLAERAQNAERLDLIKEAEDGASRVSSIFIDWTTIKSKLDQYLPDFLKGTQEAESGLTDTSQTLGFAFALPAWFLIVLAAGAMAALAYVVTNWKRVSANFDSEQRLIQDLENKVITAEQAATVIKAVKGEDSSGGILSTITQTAGQTGSILVILLGGFIAYNFLKRKRV